MKRILSIGLFSLLISSVGMAGQKGNGGDGLSLLFTEMGRRIHRELLMEPYQKDRVQLRDKISMERFYAATMETKIVETEGDLRDNHGDKATAVYRNPEELKSKWLAAGKSPKDISDFFREFPRGLIEFHRKRFQEELSLGWGVSMKTVFHEYGRAMGIDESKYNYSADPAVSAFFQRLYEQSSPVTKQVLGSSSTAALQSKIDLIDREESRLRLIMLENRNDLAAVLIARGEKVEAQKRAFTVYGHAFADMLDSVGMVPMPSPSYSARIFRKQVDALAEGMTLEQKMTERTVLDAQMRFLMTRLEQDEGFYIKLEENRQRLILQELQ